MKTLRILFSRTLAAGAGGGSVASINSHIVDCLRDFGLTIDQDCRPDLDSHGPNVSVPLHLVGTHTRLSGRPPADLAVYDDLGLAFGSPSRLLAERNVVFMHGLAGGAGTWLGPTNDAIDLFCANSPYLASVLSAILATPHRIGSRLTGLHRRPFDGVTTIPLPVAVDAVAATDATALPYACQRVLEHRGDLRDIVGHCIQPGKTDLQACCAIMAFLNLLLAQSGDARRARLFLHDNDVAELLGANHRASPDQERLRQEMAGLARRIRLRLEDIFIPVPWLPRASLFALMRECQFALAYGRVPESFGLYVLESVLNDCPVYTNGIGNLRHLLPAAHGIRVIDPEGTHFGSLTDYAEVALAIQQDLSRGDTADCQRGRERVAHTYSHEGFREGWRRVLKQLAAPLRDGETMPLEECFVEIGPLVRSWNPLTGRVVSDYRSRVLSAAEIATMEAAVGARLGHQWKESDRTENETLQALMIEGILCLKPPSNHHHYGSPP